MNAPPAEVPATSGITTSGSTTPGSGAMFDAIAKRYDLLNRLLSLGIDQRWRRLTVAALGAAGTGQVLDLATGTADLAILIAEQSTAARVSGVDPSERMLEIGRTKVERLGLSGRITLSVGEAEHLPFADASFDAATIAFGIRNVPNRLAGLRELARVTRPGGRIAILELSEPRKGLLGPLARFHVHTVVPWLGSLLSGAKEYRYLQRSIAAFPPAAEFAKTMHEAGLDVLEVTPLTFGVAHLYVGSPRAR
jgi:demethylmenaquinone methyltransferase / 2-methoxy-6-polyprenyl-1,4-benzoquinol methylase